ncbi:MAG: hypothetical protein ABIH23_18180, partial [bacterium]
RRDYSQGEDWWELYHYDFFCSRYEKDSNDTHFDFIGNFAYRISKELGREITPRSAGAYVICSQGPDRVAYLGEYLVYDVDLFGHTAMLYDATNGLISHGNIVRLGPGGLAFD